MNEEVKPGDIVYTDGVGYAVILMKHDESELFWAWNQKRLSDGFWDFIRPENCIKTGEHLSKLMLGRMPNGAVEMLAVSLRVSTSFGMDNARAEILKKLEEQE